MNFKQYLKKFANVPSRYDEDDLEHCWNTAIAGRDKTILDWLAKSKRQEKKIKRLDAEVELQLNRWVKVGKECIGLKDELTTLKQSITSAPTYYMNEDNLRLMPPFQYNTLSAELKKKWVIKVALLELPSEKEMK